MIGTDLDWNRLLEGEYNMSKSADIFLNEKGDIAKRLGKKMSVAEMARSGSAIPRRIIPTPIRSGRSACMPDSVRSRQLDHVEQEWYCSRGERE